MSDNENQETPTVEPVDERQRTTFRHSKEVVDQIKTMYESGESILKISQLFGVTSNYIHVTARRKGWERPSWYQWRFRPVRKDEYKDKDTVRKGKDVIHVVNRDDPTLLALFDQYNKEITELYERIEALDAMCNSYNRLSMVKEVYSELKDADALYSETVGSLQTEIRSTKTLITATAKQNVSLVEQNKLLKTKVREALDDVKKLTAEKEKDKKTIIALKECLKNNNIDIPKTIK